VQTPTPAARPSTADSSSSATPPDRPPAREPSPSAPRGTLDGGAFISGVVTNAGAVAPSIESVSASRLTLWGGLINNGSISLSLYKPTTSDSLNLGSFDVGSGSIILANSGEFSFAAGQTWDLIDWTGKTGTLSTSNVLLPSLPPSLVWDVSQLNASGIVSIAPVPEAGVVASSVLLTAATMLRRGARSESVPSGGDTAN
jgi:hypothetical protein